MIATVSGKTIKKELDTYPVNVPDVIDQRYNHPVLTHPLPPLILREWDERASHSSMPLVSELTADTSEDEAVEGEGDETAEEEDLFAGPSTSERRGARPSVSRRPVRGGFRGMRGAGGGYEEYGRYGEAEDSYGEEYGGSYGGRSAIGGISRQVGTALPEFTWDRTTSHVLLRYFDTTAEPGRKYRYRIRLGLGDANHLVSENYLDKSVTERRAKLKGTALMYQFTDWSKESPIVSVPLPARIYLVGAKAAKETNYNAEPKAELLVEALNSQFAAKVARAESFGRGNVVNVRDKATVIWSNKFDPDEEPDFTFRTGVTLLDFSGGERISKSNRDLTAPTRAVLMDAAGRLFLQAELDDSEAVTEFQRITEAGQDARRDTRRGRGPEEYGEEYGRD